ncbi:hypothetical protein L1987_61127 [Smallanthus sonchifolius]|uniref:Uncharacterized protein n=1 Tax=Smallanthus sonchifolius TaxID=185202 RepID=A0ACB9DAL9_9ASTR|nr:hypothetical protein L1987_61127 [Smallanthus sonchifolius]
MEVKGAMGRSSDGVLELGFSVGSSEPPLSGPATVTKTTALGLTIGRTTVDTIFLVLPSAENIHKIHSGGSLWCYSTPSCEQGRRCHFDNNSKVEVDESRNDGDTSHQDIEVDNNNKEIPTILLKMANDVSMVESHEVKSTNYEQHIHDGSGE